MLFRYCFLNFVIIKCNHKVASITKIKNKIYSNYRNTKTKQRCRQKMNKNAGLSAQMGINRPYKLIAAMGLILAFIFVLFGGCACSAESTIGVAVDSNPLIDLSDNDIRAAMHTVTVNSTYGGGYRLSLTMNENSSSNELRLNGASSSFRAIGGTMTNPQTLTPGTWGFAVAGLGGFNQGYIEQSTAESLWAAVPMSGDNDDNIIMQSGSASAVAGDSLQVWFGARLADNMLGGDYTGNVTYTVVGEEIEPPVLDAVNPNEYNLGDANISARVTLTGSNLAAVTQVCVDFNGNGGCDSGELAAQVGDATFNQLVYNFPNQVSITPGTYSVCVVNSGGQSCLDGAFTYTKEPAIYSMSPNSFNLDGDRPISMVGGDSHYVILTESGGLFAYGDNSMGQLGLGYVSNQQVSTPTSITNFFPDDDRVVKISALGWHTLALTEKGRVYSWGENDRGQVGNGTSGSPVSTPTDITDYLKLPGGVKPIEIYAGYKSSFVITDDGSTYVWGANDTCQLGLGYCGDSVDTPTRIDFPFDGKMITLAVDSHTLALTDTGHLYAWGHNNQGQAVAEDWNVSGVVTGGNQAAPVEITNYILDEDRENDGGVKIVSIGAASEGSIVMLSDDSQVVWGQNVGNFGNGEPTRYDPDDVVTSSPPEWIKWFPDDEDVVQWEAGYYATIALTNEGKVYVWGRNSHGELGLTDRWGRIDTGDHPLPTQLTTVGNNVESVYATGNSLFTIDKTGASYSWGGGGAPLDVSGDINYTRVTILGVNLDNAGEVFVDFNNNGQPDSGETCNDFTKESSTRLTCSIPVDMENTVPGTYKFYVGIQTNGSSWWNPQYDYITLPENQGFTYYRGSTQGG